MTMKNSFNGTETIISHGGGTSNISHGGGTSNISHGCEIIKRVTSPAP